MSEDCTTNDEHDWLFDYLYTIFKQSSWNDPLQAFIDEKCIVFDPDEENKLTYTEIHMEFCDLVESLLSQHLDEVGITPEDFVTICGKGVSLGCRKLNQLVLDILIAMDDYQKFKRMMWKRNVELETRAINACENHSDQSGTQNKQTKQNAEETYADALAESVDYMERERAVAELETAELEEAIRQSLKVKDAQLSNLHENRTRNSNRDVTYLDASSSAELENLLGSSGTNTAVAHEACKTHRDALKSLHEPTAATRGTLQPLSVTGSTGCTSNNSNDNIKSDTLHLRREKLTQQRDMTSGQRAAESASHNWETTEGTKVSCSRDREEIAKAVSAIKSTPLKPDEQLSLHSDPSQALRSALAARAKEIFSKQYEDPHDRKIIGDSPEKSIDAMNARRAEATNHQAQAIARLKALSEARAKKMKESASLSRD